MLIASMQAYIESMERQRRLYSLLLILLVVLLLVTGLFSAEALNSGSIAEGFEKFGDYPQQIFDEVSELGWSFFELAPRFFPALLETVNIALISTILGGALAVVLSLIATRNIDVWPPLRPITRRIMDVTRAFPELIVALLFIYLLERSALPGIIAITIHTSGALGKLFSEVNENIDQKPIDGLKAAGAGWLQRIRYAVLPQVAPNYLSYALLRLEINVRASAILGFVGAGGIGTDLNEARSWGQGRYDELGMIFLMLFVTIVVIDQISSHMRNRLVHGRAEA